IAIPVAIIGSISLSARRGIIIKDPAVLERIDTCRTAIFDKTGTLTYGEPKLVEFISRPGFKEQEVLLLTASLEQYSKHPLAAPILNAARERGLSLLEAGEIREPPGQGLKGRVGKRSIQITNRKQVLSSFLDISGELPTLTGGMECHIVIDGRYAG